jgi:YD repeat-containing protein
MRVTSFLIALLVLNASTALAGQPMPPSEIKATFFNGQPFTAASPSGTKFTMTFTPDGKMTRQTLAKSGKTNVGIWKLNAKGFCTSWEHAGSNCFTLIPSGENKWLVQKAGTTISTTIAVWSK